MAASTEGCGLEAKRKNGRASLNRNGDHSVVYSTPPIEILTG